MKKLVLLCGIMFLTLGVGCKQDLELVKNNIETPNSDFQTENICIEEGQLVDPQVPCCAGLVSFKTRDGSAICTKKDALQNSTTTAYNEIKGVTFLNFNKKDYDTAHTLPSRVVFLYFNSVNCSTCSKEVADLQSAFEELKKDPKLEMNIIGFIVDMDDKYTDLEEQALAKKFKASKHTKVFFAKESGISQFEGQWDKEMFLDYIKKIKASWNN